ncbi:hypothetical protein HYPSUDRAFT_151502 [Hypholoma sublateritium FD-334 SS-4]|uniref:SAM domain-containing protein n=1 Tax=Hypholoma sublateritium (strain FD-334 SS-4) TaxID=945553 RepID=A0A0D2KG91_HYPSF|nr:hypothetical protein HYPSUDRAFT_151502 [Hypholoma sublateritium FD-334 SS-4]
MLNQSYNPAYYQDRRQPGQLTTYLLGMGPMPPPMQQEIAVATANYMLDNPAAAAGIAQPAPGPSNLRENSEDENIDPQLRPQQVGLTLSQNTHQNMPTGSILVCMPINDKATRDIEINTSITLQDFVSHVCANMGLDKTTAQIGWKSNDDPKCAPACQLGTEEDLKSAFRNLIKMKNNLRQTKEGVMYIIHLNPKPIEIPKKKTDGNCTTDFAYREELQIVQEKLRCAEHSGINQWCYVSSENPQQHIKLSLEKVTLWTHKMVYDPDIDHQCIIPPNCLSLDQLHERTARSGGKKTGINAMPHPIHVNINNNPLAGTNSSNPFLYPSYPASGLKHTISFSSNNDTNSESLSISNILEELHMKYPKLNFPQYEDVLAEHGILYAESVSDFDKDFYLNLGVAEGTISPFLKGVGKALHCEKKERKRAKTDNKENKWSRQESVEL